MPRKNVRVCWKGAVHANGELEPDKKLGFHGKPVGDGESLVWIKEVKKGSKHKPAGGGAGTLEQLWLEQSKKKFLALITTKHIEHDKMLSGRLWEGASTA